MTGARPRRLLLLVTLLSMLSAACVDAATEHRVRANAFLRGGDAKSAVEECDKGLAVNKEDSGLLILKGKALFELDRLDESKTAYDVAIEVGKSKKLEDRALAEAYVGLGMIASRQKNWASARSHFEMLVKINPKDASSQLNVARSCHELGDFDCAVSHAEEAGRLRGNDEAVLYTLGVIYLAASKPKEAEQTFQHICDVLPGASTCPYGVALVAAKQGDKTKALEKLREAVERKVPNPENISKEPGFASLKDDPEFTKITEKAKATQ
jgi:tetratricopeptide (TPR) repeat protein